MGILSDPTRPEEIFKMRAAKVSYVLLFLLPAVFSVNVTQIAGCQLLEGQQYPGEPFTTFNFTSLANPQACANLCARTSNLCQFWTMNHNTKECFLFNSTSEQLGSNPNFTSGNTECGCILQLNTINNAPGISPGVDRIGPLRDFQDCADLCAQNPDCSYWSMNSASGICSLKRSQSQLTGVKGFVSGNIACGIDSKTTA